MDMSLPNIKVEGGSGGKGSDGMLGGAVAGGLAALLISNNVSQANAALQTSIANSNSNLQNNLSNSTASIIAAQAADTVATINATNLVGVSNLKAIGDGTVATINSTNLSSVATQKAISDGAVAGVNATNLGTTSINKTVYDGTVAALNATNLGTVSTTKTVTDGTIATISAINTDTVAIQKAIADTALSSVLSSGEVRNLINQTSYANLMASKDTLIAIKDEGAHTREESAEQFAALQLEACKNTDAIQRDILTTSAAAQLQACKDAAALAAQIAECCCEQKLLTLQQGNETRALILAESTKRCEADNANLRQENLLLRLNDRKGDK